MRRVQVKLQKSVDDSYDIEIERGLFRRIASDLRMKRFAEQYVVITDKTVARLFAADFKRSLKREKLFLGKITLPAGEKSKSLTTLETIANEMMKLGVTRKTGVIALGGGMIGDLAGFAAASFMRGIPLVHVPTTLLAMVDSSVGGKVGVDLPSGKNMVGAFYQPKKVYVDPEVLSSLATKQWKSGLGESVKYGAIKDRTLFEFFEKHEAVLNKEPKKFLPSEWGMVEEMIQRCVSIKAEVVMKDEKEDNSRQILNYGHTFGHVIELMSGYKVLHGEAIATGMRLAAAVAVKLRHMTVQEEQKQNALLDKLGLGKTKTKGLAKDFVEHMRKDKKNKNGLTLVLVDRIGRCHQQLGKYGIVVDEKIIKTVLAGSGLIDDKAPVSKTSYETPATSVHSYSQPSWTYSSSSPSSYDSRQGSSYSSFSNPMNPESGETELQRRLREMRERRARGH